MATFQAATPRWRGERGFVVTVNTIGIPQNLRALKNFNVKVERAAEKGVKKAVEFLLEQTLEVTPESAKGSKVRGVLMKPGNLKRSGGIFVKKQGLESIGVVYFNHVTAPYAIFVHEDLTKNHKYPTMAKFLQRTQWKNRGKMNQIVRDEIAKVRT